MSLGVTVQRIVFEGS